MKNINIACIIFSIFCMILGAIFMSNGINYITQVNGIAEAIVGGFLFLSGTFGLLVQVYIYNQKE